MKDRPCVLVSACLLGVDCRYDGASQRLKGLDALMRRSTLIPVCPEQLGGLPTPRVPSERRDDRVVNRIGDDVTAAFQRGAEQVCRLARLYGARLALLKARSPSCGSRMIYDGSFTGRIIPGEGVAAHALKMMGVECCDETQLEALIERLEAIDDDTF